MPGRDAQWVIGTIVAAVIALSVQMGGIRSDLAEIRADMREMRGDIRSLDDRLRAVEIAFGKSRPAARDVGAAAPAHA